jgi:F420H(2)-dependent quinone reductase
LDARTGSSWSSSREVIAMAGANVTRRIPPQRLVGLMNPLVRGLLASPLHGLVDSALLTLHVRGRRTGRRYDVPVGYGDLDGRLLVVTQHAWRANLRGGHDVEVTRAGRRQAVHAELDEEPATVAATLRRFTERAGWRATRRLTGLGTKDGHVPTLAEFEDAARAYDLAVVTLAETSDGRSPGEPRRST